MRVRIALCLLALVACSSKHDSSSSSSGSSGSGGGTSDTPNSCGAPPPKDLPIASLDLQGYPPYAADGCTLVYIAPGAGEGFPGDLRTRDLASGKETTLAPAGESPRRPTIFGDVIAWEAKDGERPVVRVRVKGETTTMSGDFASAGEPRATVNAVVFTAFHGDTLSDSDVLLFDVTSGQTEVVFGGAGQQRFPDVSKAYVAAADFSEDPDGVFNDNETDVADIVIYDRSTKAATTRARPGKQAFPLLVSSTRLGYLDWAEVHPEPKLAAYALRVGDIKGSVTSDVTVAPVKNSTGQYVLPTGRGGTLEWIDRPQGTATLWRVPADMSSPPGSVSGLGDVDIYAPASAASFTLVGTTLLTGGPLVLRGVSR